MDNFQTKFGSGWKIDEDEKKKHGFVWALRNAYFKIDSTQDFYRLQITLGTPVECRITLNQNNVEKRNFDLNPGWYSLYTEIRAADGNEFSLITERDVPGFPEDLGVMVSDIIAHDYCDNSFYKNCGMFEQKFSAGKPFISAYYYLWYFSDISSRCKLTMEAKKWGEGYLRAMLTPPQYPTLGEYVMNDPNVIEAHIDWAVDHGIDCFICNWEGMFGHRKFLSENLVHILQGRTEDGTLTPGKIPYSSTDSTGHGWDAISQGWDMTGYAIRNLERMKFSILFESRLLVQQWPPSLKEEEPYTAFGDAVTYCAENFFASPQWHRINDRPVIYIYEVYPWIGDEEEFRKFRDYLDQKVQQIDDSLSGGKFKGLYIVADVLFSFIETQDRFACFDAITGYNPYRSWTTGELQELPQDWKPLGSEYYNCKGFNEFYTRYKNWCLQHRISMIPSVISRYNDRAVRGALDHYAYPPVSVAPYTDVEDARKGTLFINNIESVLPYIDPEINMININSWNEWFEDTAIEPVGYFPSGPYPDYFAQGDNVGTSTTMGWDTRVPEKVVVYGANGHQWIETPTELREKGIDLTQGHAWPCYGFDYLIALKKFFSK